MNLYPANLEKICSILGIGSEVFFFTIYIGEQYGLTERSMAPKSIIDLTSSPKVSSILNGNGYCLTRTGVSMVNFVSCSNKVFLSGLSENVSENSCTRESTCSFLQCLNFD